MALEVFLAACAGAGAGADAGSFESLAPAPFVAPVVGCGGAFGLLAALAAAEGAGACREVLEVACACGRPLSCRTCGVLEVACACGRPLS